MKYYNLQLMRFFAASAVIFFHTYRTGRTAIDFFFSRGDFAVGLFFILSGFVITSSLTKNKDSFPTYFRKRFQKIFPLWLISLFVSIAVAGGIFVTPIRTLLTVTLLQTVYPNFSLDINFVGWSLSVEFLMYLLMYVIIMKSNVLSKGYEIATWIVWLATQAAFIYCLKIRLLSEHGAAFNWYYFVLYHPVWHLNEFLFGILIAQKIRNNYSAKFLEYKYATTVTTCAFLLSIALCFAIGYKLGYAMFYHNGFLAPIAALYIIMLAIIESKKPDAGKKTIVHRIYDMGGSISFGMYLFHISIYFLLRRWLKIDTSFSQFLIYYIAVIAFSYFVYTFVEANIIKAGNASYRALKSKRS
jgi:peptidoglycan/LPS O-acetylase OafA/YrhL